MGACLLTDVLCFMLLFLCKVHLLSNSNCVSDFLLDFIFWERVILIIKLGFSNGEFRMNIRCLVNGFCEFQDSLEVGILWVPN